MKLLLNIIRIPVVPSEFLTDLLDLLSSDRLVCFDDVFDRIDMSIEQIITSDPLCHITTRLKSHLQSTDPVSFGLVELSLRDYRASSNRVELRADHLQCLVKIIFT